MSAPTIAQLAAALAAGRTTSVALTEAALAISPGISRRADRPS
jgi:hypothetical protein